MVDGEFQILDVSVPIANFRSLTRVTWFEVLPRPIFVLLLSGSRWRECTKGLLLGQFHKSGAVVHIAAEIFKQQVRRATKCRNAPVALQEQASRCC